MATFIYLKSQYLPQTMGTGIYLCFLGGVMSHVRSYERVSSSGTASLGAGPVRPVRV